MPCTPVIGSEASTQARGAGSAAQAASKGASRRIARSGASSGEAAKVSGAQGHRVALEDDDVVPLAGQEESARETRHAAADDRDAHLPLLPEGSV